MQKHSPNLCAFRLNHGEMIMKIMTTKKHLKATTTIVVKEKQIFMRNSFNAADGIAKRQKRKKEKSKQIYIKKQYMLCNSA